MIQGTPGISHDAPRTSPRKRRVGILVEISNTPWGVGCPGFPELIGELATVTASSRANSCCRMRSTSIHLPVLARNRALIAAIHPDPLANRTGTQTWESTTVGS